MIQSIERPHCGPHLPCNPDRVKSLRRRDKAAQDWATARRVGLYVVAHTWAGVQTWRFTARNLASAMLIRDMTRAMSISLLNCVHVGRIACARGSQPYITPFSFAYYEHSIYSFATVGKRIEWMRANPQVCVEADLITSREEWKTVVAFGRYEELTNTPQLCDARVLAHRLLAEAANWWEPGYVKTLRDGVERPLEAVYFRVSIDEITGHQGTPGSPLPR
jgi:uncharacterized protein